MALRYANQYIITYLATIGGIDDSQTTGIQVQSTTGIDTTKGGIALLSYTDPLDETIAEWIYYDSINGSSQFVGVTRGAEKGSAKAHDFGVAIAFPVSEKHINQILEMFDTTGLDLAQIATPANPSSGRNKAYFKSDGKLYKLDSSGSESLIEAADTWNTLVDGATVTIDVSGNKKRFEVTLGGNRTFALSNTTNQSGKIILIRIIQDSTGSRTVTWPNLASTFTTSDVNTSTEVITVGRDIPTTTPIKFSSTGAVPTGLVAGTTYYAIRNDATSIKVASSVANAQAGTAIDLTAVGSGTHTITTEVRWPGNTPPTLTTGKNRRDMFGLILADVTNGIYEGYTIGQDV